MGLASDSLGHLLVLLLTSCMHKLALSAHSALVLPLNMAPLVSFLLESLEAITSVSWDAWQRQVLTNFTSWNPGGPRSLHSRLLHRYSCSPGWGNGHPTEELEKTRLYWGPENDPDVLRMGTRRSDGVKKKRCPVISDLF